MSTTVDKRVVEMQFDNRQFERNVSTTMSTLDKLKQSLRLTGASKGLENVNAAANRVNMGGLGSAVETVSAKFSALEVMSVTALANITNSAVNAGKRIVSALTIDPIKTGFSEYETQINAVQTILSNTKSKGSTIDDVNKALEELNKYADKTIYNFTEMTRNIGTFTAAGVDLDTSTNAIKGIANLAAMSGSTSQQASTAMYQLSQALASGIVKLMDWNSVVNAGMGGELFQDALKETARVHGVAIDSMIESEGSFRETLKDGWLTSEILTETLQKFTLTTEGLTEAQIESNREMLRAKGYTEDQINAIFELGKDATDAATKVKTFTQLWDVLKEAAQSGWAQSWKIMVGDFEEAKALFTPLADALTGIINKMSDARNELLEKVFGSPLGDILDKLKNIGKVTETVAGALKDYDAIVTRIISGEFGNGQARWDKLTEMGYDWAHAQNLVNEKLGDATRHATNYSEAQNGVAEAQEGLTETQATTLKQMVEMTDEQLKAIGCTEEEIDALRQLKKYSEMTGISIESLTEDMDQLSGRSLLIKSFKNVGQALARVFQSIGIAWSRIFTSTTDEKAEKIYGVIAAFHKFTLGLKVSDQTVAKLVKTFKGLFAIVDVVSTLFGGGLKIAFEVVKAVLSYFNLDILDVTASVGDALVAFRDWFDSILNIEGAVAKVIGWVEKAITTIKEWWSTFKDSDIAKSISSTFSSIVTSVTEWFNKIKTSEVAKDFIAGFANELKGGAAKAFEAVLEFGRSLLEWLRTAIDSHSPSKETEAIGEDFISGFINGIGNFTSNALEKIKEFGSKCVTALGEFDWGSLFAVGVSGAMAFFLKKLSDTVNTLTAPAEGIGEVLENTAETIATFRGVLKSFRGVLRSVSMELKTEALKNFAISIAILTASVIALTLVDQNKLKEAVKVVGMLAGILVALMLAITVLSWSASKLDQGALKVGAIGATLLGIAASILIIALAAKMMANMDETAFSQGMFGMITLVTGIVSLLAAYGILVKGKSAQNINQLGNMLLKFSVALWVIIHVAKMLADMSWDDLTKAAVGITGILAIIALLQVIGMIPSKGINKIGSMVLKVAAAMAIMVIMSKSIAKMEWSEMGKAAAGLLGLVAIIGILVAITKLAGKDLNKIGITVLALSASMIILVRAAKMIARMEWDEMGKAAVGLLGLSGVIAILVAIVKSVEKDAPKIAGTLLALSVAIGILALVAIGMSLISLEGLAKGVAAIGLLSSFMALMIYASRGASDCKGSIIAMAVSIGVMAAAVGLLSLIDPTKLASATLALSAVMATFALVVAQAAKLKGGMGSLIVMTVAVTLLAGALYLIAQLPIESSLAASASLSILLLSFSGAMALMGTISKFMKSAAAGMVLMLLVIAGLGGVLYLLQGLNPQQAIGTALSLSALIIALSAAMVLLSVVGATGAASFIGIGALATLIVGMGALIVGIGALMTEFPKLEEFLNKGLPVLYQIGEGIGGFFGSIVKGFIGTASEGLVDVADNLSLFIERLQPFISGVSAIDSGILGSVKNLAEIMLLMTAADILNGLTSWFTGGNSLADFGSQLGCLGTNLSEFAANLGTFSDAQVTTISCAAQAIKAIADAASDIPNEGGWLAAIVGENSLSAFADDLPGLGTNLAKFVSNLGTFGDEQAAIVRNAGEAIKALASAASEIPNAGGWLGAIFGENSLSAFSGELPTLGTNLASFVANLGSFGEEHLTIVSNAGQAIKALADAASEIPNDGGWIGAIFGENGIATFASELPALGTNLASFVSNLGTFSEDQVSTVDCAGRAIKALAIAADTIPNEGGWISKIFGDNSLASFGDELASLGTSLRNFVTNLGTFTVEQLVSITNVVGAINALSQITSINSTGSLGYFGDEISIFGTKFKEFYTEIQGINFDKTTAAITNINRIANLIRGLAGLDNSGTKTFESAVKNLKEVPVDRFIEKYSQTVSVPIGHINSLARMISNMDVDTNGVNKFTKALTNLANIDIRNVVRNFNGSVKITGGAVIDSLLAGMESKKAAVTNVMSKMMVSISKEIKGKNEEFMTMGIQLIDKLSSGIVMSASKATSAVITMVSAATAAVRGYYSNFYAAGSYLVTGFVNGINENTFRAEAQARAMAKKAKQGAEEELKVESPSKEFYRIGKFTVEGFVNALSDRASNVYTAGSTMAENAKKGFGNAIATIVDAMNSDMDFQPTIRPVMDLSNVQSGVGAIAGMFSNGATIGVATNVGTISSMMNQNGQNGGNSDVISAIEKLRSDLSNIGGDTYNVNGITYDDGSAVSDAIKSLIRAAKIERRS